MSANPAAKLELVSGAGKPKALVVDDEVDNLDLLKRVLRKDYHVYSAVSGQEALKLMEEHDFFLILTDQRMPNMLGTEFLKESLKRDPTAIRILITGYSDIESVIDAINKGSLHRYIMKPWNQDELKREIEFAIELQKLSLENQNLVKSLREANKRLEEQEQLLKKDLDERSKQLLAINDELRKLNRRLEGLTLQDGLTGLYNHRAFQQRLREELSRAGRAKSPVSLIFLDVDHFKNFNDKNGHPAGDELLKTLAGILTGDSRKAGDPSWKARASDIVARYGGEEFALILPDTPKEGGKIKAERIRKSVEALEFPNMDKQPTGRVTISIGVSTFPDDTTDAQTLIDRADQAMYFAKKNGRNRVTVFSELIS